MKKHKKKNSSPSKKQPQEKQPDPKRDTFSKLKATASGRVQMVMYRDFVCRNARKLELTGTVKNLRNGSVEVMAYGKKKDLETLVEKMWHGPPLALVKDVETNFAEVEGSAAPEDFHIVYS